MVSRYPLSERISRLLSMPLTASLDQHKHHDQQALAAHRLAHVGCLIGGWQQLSLLLPWERQLVLHGQKWPVVMRSSQSTLICVKRILQVSVPNNRACQCNRLGTLAPVHGGPYSNALYHGGLLMKVE